MVFRSKAPKGVDYLIQTREDCTRKPVFHHFTKGWEVKKKRARSAAWNLCYANVFLLIILSSCLQYKCVDFGTGDIAKIKAR